MALIQVATPIASTTVSTLTLGFGSGLTVGNAVVVAGEVSGSSALYPAPTSSIEWLGMAIGDAGSHAHFFFLGIVLSSVSSIVFNATASTTIALVGAEESLVAIADHKNSATGTTSTTITSATLPTTSVATEVCYGSAGSRGSNQIFSSPTNSFSIVSQVNTNTPSSADVGVCLVRNDLSSTGTPSFGLTQSVVQNWSAHIAALRALPSGGGGVILPASMNGGFQ